MTFPTIAVTGSTGNVGGIVARTLAGAGIAQRLLARTPSKIPPLGGAVPFAVDYADTHAAARALDGVTTLFMVSASESAERLDHHRRFIDAAASAGVEQIVYTSFYGAAPDATFTFGRDHYATEEHIKATGLTYTFLRDNFYIDFLPMMVGDDDVIRGPAGDGRVAAVAREDVARVAVAVLTDPGRHRDTAYDLTGPEALTFHQVAEIISRVSGRSVTYYNETVDEAYESRRRWEAPDWQYDAWVSTYTAIANGELAEVSGDVERLTGRKPISFVEFMAREG